MSFWDSGCDFGLGRFVRGTLLEHRAATSAIHEGDLNLSVELLMKVGLLSEPVVYDEVVDERAHEAVAGQLFDTA